MGKARLGLFRFEDATVFGHGTIEGNRLDNDLRWVGCQDSRVSGLGATIGSRSQTSLKR